jgi:hypothetical protein
MKNYQVINPGFVISEPVGGAASITVPVGAGKIFTRIGINITSGNSVLGVIG